MFENIGAKDECKFFQEPGSSCVPLSTSGQNHTGSLQLCWTCNNNEETGFHGKQNIQSMTYSNSDIWTWETIRLSCQILKIPLWQIMGCISQMNLEHFSGKTSGIFYVKLHAGNLLPPNCQIVNRSLSKSKSTICFRRWNQISQKPETKLLHLTAGKKLRNKQQTSRLNTPLIQKGWDGLKNWHIKQIWYFLKIK